MNFRNGAIEINSTIKLARGIPGPVCRHATIPAYEKYQRAIGDCELEDESYYWTRSKEYLYRYKNRRQKIPTGPDRYCAASIVYASV